MLTSSAKSKLRNLSPRTATLKGSPIRLIASLIAAARKDSSLISFGGGAPNLRPPREVIDAFARELAMDPLPSFGYTETRGRMSLREVFGQDFEKYSGVAYDPKTEIMVTDGCEEALFLITQVILAPGDEVIVTDPAYIAYHSLVAYAEAKPVYVPGTLESGFQPDEEEFKKKVSNRTKLVLYSTPDNPTGRALRPDIIRTIVDLANDYGFWILSDEAYRHITYDVPHTYTCAVNGGRDVTISTCSFSKEASMPGTRVGMMLGPAPVLENADKIKQFCTLAPSSLGQLAAKKFMEGDIKRRYLENVVLPTYHKRRVAMKEALEEYLPDARFQVPDGGLYFFVDISTYLKAKGLHDDDFYLKLFEDEKIVIIPGIFFGKQGTGFTRMTFVTETEERIDEGIKRIGKYFGA